VTDAKATATASYSVNITAISLPVCVFKWRLQRLCDVCLFSFSSWYSLCVQSLGGVSEIMTVEETYRSLVAKSSFCIDVGLLSIVLIERYVSQLAWYYNSYCNQLCSMTVGWSFKRQLIYEW